ncbi:MAG: L-serine ammonia-lyase, iron-sulfur-dependent, subunit alpha [Clostridia bacterium]|nr:L-serine ammonia-lyase, iron-sulfur-dependent, subunit alpha [Clostridia bacterium]
MERAVYDKYTSVLKAELLPAMGCTEPIAVAYAAALARATLGEMPQKVELCLSGNILKNVKSVTVPNTGSMKGVIPAAAAGIVAGDETKRLQVLAAITNDKYPLITEYISNTQFTVTKSNSGCVFDIGVTVYGGGHSAYVRIAERHTNVVHIEKDGVAAVDRAAGGENDNGKPSMSVKEIIEYVDSVDLSEIEEVVSRQIEYNSAISQEGLTNDYGARIGKILLAGFGNDLHTKAKAAAAAGSDARMNGCPLPVVIVSGSGNQGITASMPVVVYAKEMGVPREKLLRAVALSDLITVHLKSDIGSLSAYCGAVSAGCGAAAGVCYLHGGKYDEIAHTLVNALAIDSGVICDGAKSSCAAKIASAVEAGLLGFEMYRNGSQFYGGDGILEKGVENTIHNVGDLARLGMRETDEEIIKIMIKNI